MISIRRSLASAENIQSLLGKRQIVSNADQRKFYALATFSYVQLNDPGSAWIWIQKGKAGALSDIFGIRVYMPCSLLQAIYDDPGAHQLYQQELKSTENAIPLRRHISAPLARIRQTEKL